MKRNLWSSLVLFLGATCSTAVWALPNPAAVYCKQAGGTFTTFRSHAGLMGACRFERAIIESWTLFRARRGTEQAAVNALLSSQGEGSGGGTGVNPASVYCERLGATDVAYQTHEGGAISFCTFDDGSSIESWTLLRGASDPSNQKLIRVLRRDG